jgi:DNA-binding response OmpR family regulator
MGIHEKIYLIEDDLEYAREAYQELTNAGHTVVKYSSNYPNAIEQIPAAIEAGMTVAVVDGNLEYYREDCEDGREIAKSIREQAPDTIIVAFSRSSEEKANFGDIYVRKSSRELAEKVTAIPRSGI